MFILQTEMRWTWPVTVKVPADGGSFAEKQFTARFRLVPEVEWEQLGAGPDGVVSQLRAALLGVEDVAVQRDPDTAPEISGAQLIEALLAVPYVRQGLMRAYVESLTGQLPIGAAALGN